MKRLLIILVLLTTSINAQVGIGTLTPDASAMLDISSKTKGLLTPRLTSSERDDVPTPAEGLLIFNTDDKCFQYYDGSAWSGCMNTSPPVKALVCPPDASVNGYYVEGDALNATNTVSVTITTTGITSYSITTNTVNDYDFAASGVLDAAGTYQVILQGHGTPTANQTDTFTLSLDGTASSCTFDVDVLATAPIIRKNCKEIYDLDGVTTNGVQTIDPDGAGGNDAFNCYCNMTDDGGGWTLVFRHDISDGLFASDAEADSYNEASPSLSTKKYSVLHKIDALKSASDYEFRLYYPENGKRNHWTQTFDPRSGASSVRPVDGYTAINVDETGNYWGGLEKSGSQTFLDGSVNHSNWWYSIGSQVYYGSNDQIPGPTTPVNIVELYIR